MGKAIRKLVAFRVFNLNPIEIEIHIFRNH